MSVPTTASYQEEEDGSGMLMVCATLSGVGAIEAPISITLATSDSIPGKYMHNIMIKRLSVVAVVYSFSCCWYGLYHDVRFPGVPYGCCD